MESKNRSLTVAIPALNEEHNIAATVQSVLDASATVPDLQVEILVIDDGSTDRTAEVTEKLALTHPTLRLLKNPVNMGLGSSIRRAIKEATSEKFILIPGDNDIPLTMLKMLFGNAYAADMVISYFLNNECRGRKRYLLSSLFKLIYTSTFDLYLMYVNGPAVYPLSKLRELTLASTRFSIVVEINVLLLRQGATFVELPSYRQVGLEGSTSASLRSFLETVRVYLKVFADVFFRERERYSKRPIRVIHESPIAKA
jgi:glycosyltransferase involved in cell wall biosynthesis